MKTLLWHAAFAAAILSTTPNAWAEDLPVKVTEFPLAGAKGRFDFLEVDVARHRLLANHTDNGTLDVFALPDGTLLKRVAVGAAQGVAVDPKRQRYFVTVSDRKQVAVVDAESVKEQGVIELPGAPDGLALDAESGLLYVDHDDATEVWVVDPDRKAVVATLQVPKEPEYVVADPDRRRIYQNVKSRPALVVIDATTHTVTDTWATNPAEKPHGLAFDARRRRLYIAGANGKLAVLDADSGQRLGDAEIAPGVDQIVYDPGAGRVYCASGQQGISVVAVDGDLPKLLGTVKTPRGTHTLNVDPETHAVWTACGDSAKSALVRLEFPASK